MNDRPDRDRRRRCSFIIRNSSLVIVCLLLACAPAHKDDSSSSSPPAAQFSWTLDDRGTLSIRHGGRELYRLIGVDLEGFSPDVAMLFGFFRVKKSEPWLRALRLEPTDDGGIALTLDETPVGTVTLAPTASGNLRVSIEVAQDVGAQALRPRFACFPGDRFWGFGEQYNFVEMRGRTVPIWTQEQGIGRVESPRFPPVGSLTDTYFPMPYFVDPGQGKGFLIENTEYAAFDLGVVDPSVWNVEVWNGRRVSLLVLPGPTGKDVVRELTAEVGRPTTVPPDWAFSGVWLASQGGPGEIEARLAAAGDAGVPVTAVWVQDWLGEREFGLGNFGVKYRWTADETLYPGLADTIADLRGRGVRFLGYFNPFVVPDYEQFAPGAEAGYLVTDAGGDPYTFPISTFQGGLVDLTNPDAVAWFQGFADAAVALGMSGWMADFGEWLPFDAVLAAGEAPAYHNLYSTAWHRANREALERASPDGDFVLLTRSGYTGEQGVAQVVWAGDQEADWSPSDGLPTVVAAGLTLGLSGVPFFTHDIAGFSGGPSTKELFQRWTELGAFTPVMRTHDGLKKGENHRFDSDPATLAHFAAMAKLHAALFPVFRALAGEAAATGLPILRHTALCDPAWAESFKAHAQWMIGDDLLVAPVVTEGAQAVRVFVPEGDWEHLLTGERFAGRSVVEIAAPIGLPAALVRVGKFPEVVAAARAAIQE
jgi:alpha-glucosidase